MTLLELATDLQTRASGEGIFDALDEYYADDVTIVEANGDTFYGKDTQRGRIQEFLGSIEEEHGGGLLAVAAYETGPGTGVVFAESTFDATMTGVGRMSLDEVAVQRWENGKVVHERFYYNDPMSGGAA
jgi:ketosteroid isomerase-like protein